MRPMPIRYVRDVDAARRFYAALGMSPDFSSRPARHGTSMWTELSGDGAGLALHYAAPDEPSPDIELSFEADEPLEHVVARLREAGYPPHTAIVDESFGRSFSVRDPEGLLIQVNEHDRDLQR